MIPVQSGFAFAIVAAGLLACSKSGPEAPSEARAVTNDLGPGKVTVYRDELRKVTCYVTWEESISCLRDAP